MPRGKNFIPTTHPWVYILTRNPYLFQPLNLRKLNVLVKGKITPKLILKVHPQKISNFGENIDPCEPTRAKLTD